MYRPCAPSAAPAAVSGTIADVDHAAAPTGLTAGQVCRELGLVPSTLRAWNRRYGIGPSDHQAGRHRLYDRADVAALARMQALIAAGTPAAVAAATVARARPRPGAPSAPRTARGLGRAVLALDSAAVQDALIEGVRRGGPLHLWHRLYRPVITDIGRQVAQEGHCMEAERLLSWAACAALHLISHPAGPGWPRVILACAEGEQHTVGLEVVRALLAEQDVATTMLGADTPTVGLEAAAVATNRPVIVLAAQTRRAARPARLKRLGRSGEATVIAAGPGWDDVPLATDTLRAATVEQAVAAVVAALST